MSEKDTRPDLLAVTLANAEDEQTPNTARFGPKFSVIADLLQFEDERDRQTVRHLLERAEMANDARAKEHVESMATLQKRTERIENTTMLLNGEVAALQESVNDVQRQLTGLDERMGTRAQEIMSLVDTMANKINTIHDHLLTSGSLNTRNRTA